MSATSARITDHVPLRVWLMASRPRTLPAAVAPVLVGTALAGGEGTFRPLRFFAALIGAIFIQIGTNLANDYSDARRGADTEDRLGPVRVTAQGLAAPRKVLTATWLAFAIAIAAGVYLAAVTSWLLILVGLVSIAAGVLYTGGPKPYGYEGIGELFVFVFFGLVAVAGSYYVQVERVTWEAVALAVPIGLLSCAILMVNNIRDIDTDRRAGKRTLAVRLGRGGARRVFVCTIYLAFIWQLGFAIGAGKLWTLLALLAVPLVPPLARTVMQKVDGASLNRALARSGMLLGMFAVLAAVGLMASGPQG